MFPEQATMVRESPPRICDSSEDETDYLRASESLATPRTPDIPCPETDCEHSNRATNANC